MTLIVSLRQGGTVEFEFEVGRNEFLQCRVEDKALVIKKAGVDSDYKTIRIFADGVWGDVEVV